MNNKEFKYKIAKGVKRNLILKGNAEEKFIQEFWGGFFGVTFSKQGRFKTTDYTFAFLKPEDKFRESFNMYNEVLLLFSPYTEFESRTMDFVDKTLQEYDNRLDKVCILLVSKDQKIDIKIRQLNNENKDSKIIVPFKYDEFKNNELDIAIIENRFRDYFYSRDLFALESPLKADTYFYGRKQIVQNFYDKYMTGEQSGLFGLRKIGKTSVLYALERLIKLRGGNSIFLDCQDTKIHKSRWNELLNYIIEALITKYNISDSKFYEIEHYTEKDASKCFEADLLRVKSHLNNRRILLIFDEIEHITFRTSSTNHWAEENDYIYFWQTIRAVYQKNSSLFSFVLAGVNPLCIETSMVNNFDNPIFLMVNPTYLELFSVQDVKEMVQNIGNYMGLKFDEEVFTLLTNHYGGHPFLIRHICSLIHKEVDGYSRPYTVTKYEYNKNKSQYDEKIVCYIESIIQGLNKYYAHEYELLEILILKGHMEFEKICRRYNNAVEHLTGYGVLKKINNEYHITIEAIDLYVKENKKYREIPDTKEAIWQEITTRRNKLEENLRKIIIMKFMLSSDEEDAKKKIMKVIEEKRREKMNLKELKNIVKNELYLLDLKKIIEKNWVEFEKIFNDKNEFSIFFDFINKNRVDAHSKSISEKDLALLQMSFKWFEEKIEPYDY